VATPGRLLSVSLQSVTSVLSFCQRQIRVGLDARGFHRERLLTDGSLASAGPSESWSFQLAQPCV
jgi:hypothetical protein